MKTPVITMEEWIDAQQTARTPPEGSFTVADIKARTGFTRQQVRNLIDKGIVEGRLKCVGFYHPANRYVAVQPPLKGKKQ